MGDVVLVGTTGPTLRRPARQRSITGRSGDTFHLGWLLTTGRSDDTLVSVTGRSLAHVIWPVSIGTLRRCRVVGVRGLRGLDKLGCRRSGRFGDTLRGCAGFMWAGQAGCRRSGAARCPGHHAKLTPHLGQRSAPPMQVIHSTVFPPWRKKIEISHADVD